MSRGFSADQIAGAQAVSIGALGLGPATMQPFRARFADGQQIDTYRPQGHDAADPALDPLEQARADAFAEGFDAGARVTRESAQADSDMRDRLAIAIENLSPAHNGALASMLSAAVLRLVGQIVGQVPVDADLLRARAEAVAGFIEQEQGRNNLHVHPDDVSLLDGCALGATLVPDASMPRGCIRLDTSDGWIEDGPDVQLSRLKAMLDDMEGRA